MLVDQAHASGGEELVSALVAAMAFAAWKHQDQRRKGRSHRPYINHPIAVLQLLWDVGRVRDPATLTAALLHDTVEDTDTTLDEIREAFGADVARVVAEVTDDKSLPKAVRKQLQVEHAASVSVPAKLIKLADKISNVREVAADPPEGWSLTRKLEYLEWSAAVVEGLRGVNTDLEVAFSDALLALRVVLA
jgi:guanosine-3',5'-bis(diphosphate) 3'-pyrophosphohydrolase